MSDIEITEYEKVTVAPGDVLVVRIADPIRREHVEMIRSQVKQVWPDNEVLILAAGVDLDVYTPQDVAA